MLLTAHLKMMFTVLRSRPVKSERSMVVGSEKFSPVARVVMYVVVRMMRSMWMVRLVRNLMVKTVKMVMMVGDLHGVGDAGGARSGLEAMCLTPSSPLGQSHEL